MSEKLGRNPFGAGKNAGKGAGHAKPETASTAGRKKASPKSGETSARTPRPTAAGFLRKALGFQMSRFSLMRYDRDPAQSKLALVSLGLSHPHWRSTGHYELKLLKRGPLALTLVSLRIQAL